MKRKLSKSLVVLVLLAFLTTTFAATFMATGDGLDSTSDVSGFADVLDSEDDDSTSGEDGVLPDTAELPDPDEENGDGDEITEGVDDAFIDKDDGSDGNGDDDVVNNFQRTDINVNGLKGYFSYEDLESWSAIFPLFEFRTTGNTVAAGGKTDTIQFYMSNTADQFEEAERTIGPTQVRFYISNVDYLKDIDAVEAYYNYFTAGWAQVGEDIDDDGNVQYYLYFDIAEMNAVTSAKALTEFQLDIASGSIPNGSVLGLRAEIWYKGGGDEYRQLTKYTAELDYTITSVINWGTSVSAAPSVLKAEPSNGDYDLARWKSATWDDGSQPNKSLSSAPYFNVAVAPGTNSTYNAKRGATEATLTLPEGVTASIENLRVVFSTNSAFPNTDATTTLTEGGVTLDAADLEAMGIYGYSFVQQPDGSFTLQFEYEPGGALTAFYYRIYIDEVTFADSIPRYNWGIENVDMLRQMTLNASSKVRGVADADDVWQSESSNSSSIGMQKPPMPPAADENLMLYTRLEKTLEATSNTQNSNGGFKNGDSITFEIGDIEFGNGQAYEVDNFTISDYGYSKELIPTAFSLGSYSIDGAAKLPEFVRLTMDDGTTYTYTYADFTTQLTGTVDLATLLAVADDNGKAPSAADKPYTVKNIASISIGFGTVNNSFKVETKPQYTFTVNNTEPVYDIGKTVNNKAKVEFDYKKPERPDTEDPFHYEFEATQAAQLARNDQPYFTVEKEVENVTESNHSGSLGSQIVSAPGETLRYTITLTNTTPVNFDDNGNLLEADRVIVDPKITDILPSVFFDLNTIENIESKVSNPNGSGLSLAPFTGTSTSITSQANYPTEVNHTKTDIDGDPYTTELIWKYSGELSPGGKIVITFDITFHDYQHFVDKGIDISEFRAVDNHVSAHHHGTIPWDEDGEANSEFDIYGARPFISYGLDITPRSGSNDLTATELFESGTTRDVTYTATAANLPNDYDGSEAIDKLVLTGRLPAGFYFDINPTQDNTAWADNVLDLFSFKHSYFTLTDLTVDKSSIQWNEAGNYVTMKLNGAGFGSANASLTLRLEYITVSGVANWQRFTVTLAGAESTGDDNAHSNAVLHYESRAGDGTPEEFSVSFTGKTSSRYGFTANYSSPFTAYSRLYAWTEREVIERADDGTITSRGNYDLVNLNDDSHEPGYRYVANATGHRVDHIDDSVSNFDSDVETLGALQDYVSVRGKLELPTLELTKTASGKGSTTGNRARSGDTMSYTLKLNNSTLGVAQLSDVLLLDTLPISQTFVGANDELGVNGTATIAVWEYDETEQKMVAKANGTVPVQVIAGSNGQQLVIDTSALTGPEYSFAAKYITTTESIDNGDGTTTNKDIHTMHHAYVQITYTARVLDNYMDHVDEHLYEATHVNNAAMAIAEGNRDYYRAIDKENTSDEEEATASLVTDFSTLVKDNDTFKWAEGVANGKLGTGNAYIVATSANAYYVRERISMTVAKTGSANTSYIDDGDRINWTLTVKNPSATNNTTVTSPVVMDVMPKNLVYDPNSARAEILNSSAKATTKAAEPVVYEIQYDFGAGPEDAWLLVWQFNGTSLPRSNNYYIEITYSTTVTIEDVRDASNYGIYTNTVYALPSEAQQDLFYSGNTSSSFVPDVNDVFETGTLEDILEKLGYNRDEVKAVTAEKNIEIWGSYGVVNYKEVVHGDESTTSSDSPNYIQVGTSERFSYRLVVENTSVVEDAYNYENITMLDRLPYVGDTDITTGQPRGSQFAPNLGTVALLDEYNEPVYDAQDNLILLPDVSVHLKTGDGTRQLDEAEYKLYFTNDTSNTNYTTAQATANLNWFGLDKIIDGTYKANDVTGIRVEMNSSIVLKSGQILYVDVPMVVPANVVFQDDAELNEFSAWNTYALSMRVTGATTLNVADHASRSVGVRAKDQNNSSITLQKVDLLDTEGNEVSMAGKAFTVKVEGPSGYEKTVTLNEKNSFTVTLDGLSLGTYTVTEITDQDGSNVADLYDVAYEVTIDGTTTVGGTFMLKHLPGQNALVEITNQQKEATLEVTKLLNGEENNAEVDGTMFYLLDSSKNIVDSDAITGGKLKFEGLAWGTYLLVEVAPADTIPANGFAPMDAAGTGITLTAGEALYYKTIQLPSSVAGGGYTAHSAITVDNIREEKIVELGSFSLTKTWNGSNTVVDKAWFFLLPVEYAADDTAIVSDINDAIVLSQNGNKFSAGNLSPGKYLLFEVTNEKYTPSGWAMVDNSFTYGEIQGKLWSYPTVIEIEEGAAHATVKVNNTYYVPPVDPDPGPSSSSSSSKAPTPSSTSQGGGGNPDPGPGPGPDPDPSSSSSAVVRASSTSTASGSSSSSSDRSGSSSNPTGDGSEPGGGGGDGGDGDGSTPGGGGEPGPGTPGTPGSGTGLGEDGRYGSVMESLQNNLQALLDGDVPLGNFSLGSAWSLLNLICGLAGVIISIVLTIGTFVNKRKQKDEEEDGEKPEIDYATEDEEEEKQKEEARKRSKIMKTATVVVGVLTMVLFLILEDIRQPMVWITRWTPIIVPTFAVHLVLLLLYRLLSKKEDEESNDDEPDEGMAPA